MCVTVCILLALPLLLLFTECPLCMLLLSPLLLPPVSVLLMRPLLLSRMLQPERRNRNSECIECPLSAVCAFQNFITWSHKSQVTDISRLHTHVIYMQRHRCLRETRSISAGLWCIHSISTSIVFYPWDMTRELLREKEKIAELVCVISDVFVPTGDSWLNFDTRENE